MSFLLRFLTWWNSQTLNTQFWTWRNGIRVGEDSYGNVYYKTRDGKRRWVIYKAEAEASQVSSEWHGWLHHTWNEPPSEVPLPRKVWEQPHKPNLTGSSDAYVPAGSIMRAQPAVRSDYDAWQPD